jgi:pSer/pThr/pTyr-binding forkhead associated (FHA) protein
VKLIVLKNNVPLNEVSVETTDSSEMHEIYVGRSEDCHVQIDDPLISRHHFVLKNDDSNWYCEKLSQLGVITIHGALVIKNLIQNGDEIKCGPYSLIVSDLTSLHRKAEPEFASGHAQMHSEEVYKQITPSFQRSSPVPEPESELVHVPEPLDETMMLSDEEPADEIQSLDDLSGIETLDEDTLSDSLNFNSEETETAQGGDQDFGSSDISESAGFDSEESSENNYEVSTTENDQDESTRFFKAFVNYQLVLFGEHAPYDRFQIDQDNIYIGREQKKCQIVLNDPEVSSVHAVLKKNHSEIILEDLNSSNGTILNGERINKAAITAGDEFVIGGTSFTLEVRSDLLESESERLMPVESGQVLETEEVIEEEISGDEDLTFNSDAAPEKSLIKRIWKDPAKRKRVLIVLSGLAILMLFVETEETAEDKPKKANVTKEGPKNLEKDEKKLNLSKELENARNVSYELGVSFFEQSRYDLAQVEFQKVVGIDPNYKKVQSYLEQTNVGLKRIQELEAERRAEEDRIKMKKIIDELLVKAREAVKERQVQVAESYFSQIIEKDPENIEVSQLKLELESWQKEEERKALERAARESARKKMVDLLNPGKTFYLKKEWNPAISRLEDFLRIKEMDEDLIKEASEMLSDAKNQLASELGPLLGKARSLKEGQDLKAAYEAYLEVNRIDPTNKEALDEIDDIKSNLDARSRKIYREAIIAESLSLFSDAKEKFQEVQQISPTDSEYYKKATEKLRNYLE